MMQQCVRWLVPIDDSWVASATGRRRHYVPREYPGKLDWTWAGCGTVISRSMDQLLRNDGRYHSLPPCQRCVESAIKEREVMQAQMQREAEFTRVLLMAI